MVDLLVKAFISINEHAGKAEAAALYKELL